MVIEWFLGKFGGLNRCYAYVLEMEECERRTRVCIQGWNVYPVCPNTACETLEEQRVCWQKPLMTDIGFRCVKRSAIMWSDPVLFIGLQTLERTYLTGLPPPAAQAKLRRTFTRVEDDSNTRDWK